MTSVETTSCDIRMPPGPLRRLALLVVLVATLAAEAVSARPLVVGGREGTEQRLLVAMTALLLRTRGYEVATSLEPGTALLRAALTRGEVDIVWDHTGTALTTFHRYRELPPRDEVYPLVRDLDAQGGLVWLQPSRVQGGHALAMSRERAEKLEIASVSDLARAIGAAAGLQLATTDEFFARPDGLKPLQTSYDFRFPRDHVHRMSEDAIYHAISSGEIDVAVVQRTDPQVTQLDLVTLDDDRGFFPPYELVPVVRQVVLDDHPGLTRALNALAALLDDEVMRALNGRVDLDGQEVEPVAYDYLFEAGLVE
jgi:osmoprotectant transport system substrate-binding protein